LSSLNDTVWATEKSSYNKRKILDFKQNIKGTFEIFKIYKKTHTFKGYVEISLALLALINLH